MNFLRKALAVSVVSGCAALAFIQPAHAVIGTLGTGECAQQVDGLTGSVTRSGNYCLIAIKGPTVSSGGSGTWVVPAEVTEVDVLVVGGGGGGGNFGGGGAGAMYEGTEIAVTPAESIGIAVGAGGAGSSSVSVAGSHGLPSSFDDIVAYGGGGGSSVNQSAGATVYSATSPGGSGGGAVASPVGVQKARGDVAGTSNLKQEPVSTGSIAGTAGVGSRTAGGDANAVFAYLSNANYSNLNGSSPGIGLSITFWIGAGGGGAAEPGGDVVWESDGTVGKTGSDFNTTAIPGVGGAGQATSLLESTAATELAIGEVVGQDVYFAGGGGGRSNFDAATTEPKVWDYSPSEFINYSLNGIGGTGGGGGIGEGRVINGAPVSPANAGFANTGGGGKATGAGGTGIVVIRYLIPGSVPPPVDPPIDPSDDNASPRLADTGATTGLIIGGSLISALLLVGGIGAIRRSRIGF